MNCRRVEKLIPLYVERDLESGASKLLALHLESCGRCNWLADEYKDSQGWLRASEPPEFDAASLNEFKTGILRRIEETSAKPSRLAAMMQQWSGRQVLALSAAMLIIFGVVVFYIYQARMSATPQTIEAIKQPPDSQNAPGNKAPQIRDTERATGASLRRPHHSNTRTRIKQRDETAIIREQAVEPNLLSRANQPEKPGAVSADPAERISGDVNESPGMLRIEIQTSDPNIRIIWFAPKEVESPKTNQ